MSVGYEPAMPKLAGKVAIVTGAASGIGKAAVELFRDEGAIVIGADVSEDADVRADAGSDSDVRALVDRVVREHGGVDIFFANAGISGGLASISEQTAEDWATYFAVNLIGPFLAIKHSAPLISCAAVGRSSARPALQGSAPALGAPPTPPPRPA